MYIGNMKDHEFDKKYDLIYTSWGLNYLSDSEALQLLENARGSLEHEGEKPGTFVLKETIRDSEEKFIPD